VCATRPILKCGLKDQDHDKKENALKKVLLLLLQWK